MKVKYEDRLKQKLLAITPDTLVVGVDIAKNDQWARFVDFRGIEHSRALKFKNRKGGFETILARIREICKKENFTKAVVGMEPTGHYWKAFANWLEKQDGITVVLVNPYATKQAKELDDNSQTKSDKKDALTIAKLVKDGRYFELYLPHDIYAELRGLSTTRIGLNKRKNALKNTITALLDEFFPEYEEVFKHPLTGKASRHILKTCPFPKFIMELGEEGVTEEIKKAVKKTVDAQTACADIMKRVDAGKVAPVYLLMGEETYYIDFLTRYLLNALLQPEERDFNLLTMFGADTDVVVEVFYFHTDFPFSSSRFNALYSAKVIPVEDSFAGMSRLL